MQEEHILVVFVEASETVALLGEPITVVLLPASLFESPPTPPARRAFNAFERDEVRFVVGWCGLGTGCLGM